MPALSRVQRILLCSGRIYYDLVQRRSEEQRDDIAIIRIEEFHPLPTEPLKQALAPYADGTPVIWVQDEPRNMGPWWYLQFHYGNQLDGRLPLSAVTRPASASPATGSAHSHRIEQQRLLNQVFDVENRE